MKIVPTRILASVGIVALFVGQALCSTQSPPLMVKQPPTDELLFQVATRIDENDKPFIIECEAEGEPAPKYRWEKNGHEFLYQTEDYRISQQPGRGTLVITQPKDVDIGQYQCFATNEFGTAASNSVFVRKSELSNFKEEPPKSISEQEGKPFSLRCQPPDGWPKPSVYWMIQSTNGALRSVNSSRMTVDPEGTLWFSNITREDSSEDFLYACSATSKFRNEYKLGNRVYLEAIPSGNSAVQNRHEPVQQYVSRKNMVGYRGERVELWCVFGGTPLPQIKWNKRGGALTSSRVDYTNYGKTLVIKSVDFEDEGSYECGASNGVGSPKSYSITLEVQAKPYFTVEPEVVRAAEDDTAVFRCEASGKPAPEIQWIHNGKPIESFPSNPRRKVRPNEIVIEKLTKQDTGNYGCNATNSLGYAYKDVYLNVLALPPEIVEPPEDIATVDGSSVNMTCKVTGAPKPEVKWVRDGLELTGGRYKVMEDGNLEIRDVTFSDAGAYSCFALNKFGSIDATGNLVVKERTRIVDEPEDYEVAAGSTATFRCTAISDSSLTLRIDWMNENETIDFEQEPRFVQSQDFSLTITKTTELDTGEYTCVARTELDSATAKASLIVEDVPNAPKLVGVRCNPRDAVLEWIPQGDNRSPIIMYTVQHNTSFTPDSWEVSFESVPATDRIFTVPMSPWSNYTFRVIARNKIGPSLPSLHSDVCTTPPDVPYRNPDGVEGRGTAPDNLEIRWTPMPEIEHNAPRFYYRVYWRRDIDGSASNIEDVTDWKQSSVVIPNQPTFERYRIKVVAINERGEANVAAQEVNGWSGEDRPLDAPTNFTLKQIIDAKSALLSWNPINPFNVRGHFKGYQIETWTDKETEAQAREVVVSKDSTNALVHKFVPHALNRVRIRVINSAYKGPPSEVITFTTPEGRPGAVDMLEAIPMGSSAFYLIWKAPEEPNGKLTGYRLFYQKVEGTKVGPLQEREPPITDPTHTRAKLAGLEPGSKYRIEIRATTVVGDGEKYFIERTTQSQQFVAPDKPKFTWYQVNSDSGFPAVKLVWHPNVDGRPGSHFYAQYRRKGEPMFESTPNELYEDFIIVRGLDDIETYDMRIVAVDGDHTTASDTQEVTLHPQAPLTTHRSTYPHEADLMQNCGLHLPQGLPLLDGKALVTDGPYVRYKESVATSGWFIGMLLAVAFLLIVLILVCVIKKNRGGKYAVHEREALHGRHDYPDEVNAFPEYNQAAGRVPKSSISSDFRMPHESDTDSMAEYGDGDADGMNEDGSFIGQYGRKRLQQENVAINPYGTNV